MSITRALKWSFLSEFSVKAFQPIIFLIVASVLTPKDFGVVASAMIVISFTQIFWEFGLSKALIQRQDDLDKAANFSFFTNLSLGLVLSISLFFSSDFLANFLFHDSEVSFVLKVMCLQVLLSSLSSIPSALLQKNFLFHKLFWVRFGSIIIPGVISLVAALNGLGYWALILSAIIGQFIQMIMFWFFCSWRPSNSFDLRVSKEILTFSGWVVLTGLITWYIAWIDSFFVGHYFGVKELGLYNLGGRLPTILFSMVFGPVVPVLYSYLSSLNFNRDMAKKLGELALLILSIISIPIVFIISQSSNYIELIFFGEKWKGLGEILSLMVILHGYSWIVGMNGEFYRAMGKPSFETIILVCLVFLYSIVYAIIIPFGLDLFVQFRVVLAFFALFFHLMMLKKLLNINIKMLLLKIIIYSAVSFFVVMLSKFLFIDFLSLKILGLVLYFIFSLLSIILIFFFLEKKNILNRYSQFIS